MQALHRNLQGRRIWHLSGKTRDSQSVDSGKLTIWDPAITQIGLHCTFKGFHFFSKMLIISSFHTQKALSLKRMIENLKRVWQLNRNLGRKSKDNLIVVVFKRLCRKVCYFIFWKLNKLFFFCFERLFLRTSKVEILQ